MLHTVSIVNGKSLGGAGDSITVKNPSDLSEIVGEVTFSTPETAQEAVQAARVAFPKWRRLTGDERGRYLYAMGEALERHLDEVATLASQEMGKPLAEMKGEVIRGVNLLKYYAAEGVRAVGHVIPSSAQNVLQYTKRVPLGVAALITPWNFPVAIPIWKLAPALICGNTVVWKPAENASLSAYKLMEVFMEAGLPEGVVNLVIGRGQDVGAYLSEEAPIDVLSFTGSTGTGLSVATGCARRNVKYQTEMGGKNAAIVLNDADLEASLPAIISGAFRSAGQKCTATSRVIVEESIYDSFIEFFIENMKTVKLGHALEPGTYLGPVASKEQFEKVQHYVQLAKSEADVIYENQEAIGYDGYYIHPLIITGVSSDHRLFQEEIFGPVVTVMKVKNFDEAIYLLNQTSYGLSGSVFTNNISHALRFLDEADIGMVRVNLETAGVEYQAPFGGMKQSSSHTREQGQAALDFYSIVKTCAIKY